MPRLGDLRERHGDLHIDIDTRPHALARLDEGLDAAIALAREVDPALYAVRLGPERIIAIGGGATRDLAIPPTSPAPPSFSTATCPTPSTIGAKRSACPI